MKDKIIKILESKYFLLYLLIYSLVAFLINITLSMAGAFAYQYVACFFSVIYSIVGFLCLFFLNDTKNIMMMVFFFPLFHGTLSNKDMATLLAFSPALIMVVGLFIHHIKFKTKLKMTPMIPGAIVFWLGICVGGIGVTPHNNCQADYYWYYTLIYAVVSALIIYIMLVLSNDSKMKFIDYAKTLSFAGLLIIVEIFSFIVLNLIFGEQSYFDDKILQLGWGNANTAAIILLMLIPCSFYLLTKTEDRRLRIFYHILGYLMIIALIATFSRIGILVGFFEYIICLIFAIKYSLNKKESYLLHGISIFVFLLGGASIFLIKPHLFEEIVNMLSDIRPATLNGRRIYYETFVKIFNLNKTFGVGLIGSFHFDVDPAYPYNFCHSTIFELMLVSGSLGLCALLYHLIEKYGRLIIKMNREKFILLLSFLFPGLYGLVDATYLVPVYMVSLFISYCMVLDIFKE